MLLREIGKGKAKILAAARYEPARNIDPEANGEYRFLAWLANLPAAASFDSIIDVGANRGEWTGAARAALMRSGVTQFYCVEPIPALAAEIRKRFPAPLVTEVLEMALSNLNGGEVSIYDNGGGGGMYRSFRGDVGNPAGGKRHVEFRVPQRTGDDVFLKKKIQPYLLKIDCDGHDLRVLEGFNGLLNLKRPIVQFEYCEFWIGSRTRLKDACSLLRSANYTTFKMFPDQLVRFKYNPMFETYGYQNIVAAPSEFASFAASTLKFSAIDLLE